MWGSWHVNTILYLQPCGNDVFVFRIRWEEFVYTSRCLEAVAQSSILDMDVKCEQRKAELTDDGLPLDCPRYSTMYFVRVPDISPCSSEEQLG